MNARIMRWALLPAVLVMIPSTLAQSGGQYELSWTTIDGGGGQVCMFLVLIEYTQNSCHKKA